MEVLSSGASPSLADRLATACFDGDLPAAEAAVADGASVNEEGKGPWGAASPLVSAIACQHWDVAVWLLSHGADPNGDYVIHYCVCESSFDILQLVIDAGGDVNRDSGDQPPLFWAISWNVEDAARVLLAQPALDLSVTYGGQALEQHARDRRSLAVAELITQEVSETRLACFSV